MQAHVGDWLVIRGRNLDDPSREGLVIEVPHPDGSPPYRVRWIDDDSVSLVFPGPDATVSSTAPHARTS